MRLALKSGAKAGIADEEVEKLVARGRGWLESHPLRETIARRYLKHRGALANKALAKLSDSTVEEAPSPETLRWSAGPLSEQRINAVTQVLADSGASRVLDIGCGEGRLLEALMDVPQFTETVGIDVAVGALARAERRLRLDRLPDRQRNRVKLMQGSLTYRDRRLAGYDAAAVVEALEHVDPGPCPCSSRRCSPAPSRMSWS